MTERPIAPYVFAMDRRALLLGAGALGLTGCTTAEPPPVVAVRGLDRLPLTQGVMNKYVVGRRLPGVGLGVRMPDGDDVFLQAGTLDFNVFAPVGPDSLFRIYSMTKPITGVAAALLIEDGQLSLDTPVAEFIPEFADMTVAIDPAKSLDARPAATVMTIRHLLTHTSGLTYNFAGDGPINRQYRRLGVFPFTGEIWPKPEDAPKVHDLDALAAALAQIPLLADPGTAYNYSVSLDVLGLVIQRVSGMPFPDFVQQRILNPVSMADTVWRLRPGDAARLMQIYDFGRSGTNPPVVAPGSSPEDYSAPVTLYAGGAGLVSSTRDYLAFLSMLLNDGRAGRAKVMQPQTARLIRSDILPQGLTAEGGGFGFGGWVARPGHRRQAEYGWSGAASTQGWIDPEKNFAAAMMIQAMPYGAVDILSEIRRALDTDLGVTRMA